MFTLMLGISSIIFIIFLACLDELPPRAAAGLTAAIVGRIAIAILAVSIIPTPW